MQIDDTLPWLRWLYIDFNSYFASVEQQERPELRGRPIIVVPVETDATCAIAASYEAKAFGIKTGTPVHEAKKVCPGLLTVLARHDAYVAYHHRILAEIDRHFPITMVCSIDEVAYRLMRNDQPEVAAVALAKAVKLGLARTIGEHVRCSIGLGPNRYLAKVAAEMRKPDGLTVLRRSDLPERLHDLSLRDLPGIGPNMQRRLHQAGIETVPALLSLGPDRLRSIWGNVWGERMWSLLRGADLPEQETTRRTIGHSHVMAPDLREAAKARHVARRLLLKAASRLRRMGHHASALSFSARLENGQRLRGEERCWRAQDNATFLALFDRMWHRLVEQPGVARLKKVSVTLHGLTAAAALAPDLFDAPTRAERRNRAGSEMLSRAMDTLNRRFGRDTVLIGLLPEQGRSFSGTKIAFTRIPDREEFRE